MIVPRVGLSRRRFLLRTMKGGTLAWLSPWPASALASETAPAAPTPFEVRFRKPHPYEALRQLNDPGRDEFVLEKNADAITVRLHQLLQTKSLPLAQGFRG